LKVISSRGFLFYLSAKPIAEALAFLLS
jgi:hypothetical protein